MNSNLVLRCTRKIFVAGSSIDSDLHVLTRQAERVPAFEFMCETLDAMNNHELQSALKQIDQIKAGAKTVGSIGIDQSAALFDSERAWFWREFDENGEEFSGGHVTLDQFELAVKTYFAFRMSASSNVIEVPFPDQ